MESPVTVVVPTFNRCPDVQRVLDNLLAQPGAPLRVVIVDNSSTDDTAAMVAGRQPDWRGRLTYLRKTPEGPASARQLGLMTAETPYVLFHDSDVELESGWVVRALARLTAAPDVAAVGGSIVYAFDPARINAYGGELNWFGLAWDVAEGQPRDAASAVADRVWINCSAMLARRADVIEAGGFDETFFYGYEDTDIGWRLRLAGKGVAVAPELVARHHVDASPGTAHPDIVFHANKNRLRMLLRNAERHRLPWVIAGTLGYLFCDLLLRGPRSPKWRAFQWNRRHLEGTLALRAATQGRRRVGDAVIFACGSGRWFPPSRLRGHRRRPVAAGAARDQPVAASTGRPTDDRI